MSEPTIEERLARLEERLVESEHENADLRALLDREPAGGAPPVDLSLGTAPPTLADAARRRATAPGPPASAGEEWKRRWESRL